MTEADRIAWLFEFVAGPFDGYRIDEVPTDEVDPGEDPPAELLLWNDGTMHVRAPDQADVDPNAERYLLLDADIPGLSAVYEWADVAETGAASLTMAVAA